MLEKKRGEIKYHSSFEKHSVHQIFILPHLSLIAVT